ncbi:unnamed protein product, partial [Scytosiphon promiscuus]
AEEAFPASPREEGGRVGEGVGDVELRLEIPGDDAELEEREALGIERESEEEKQHQSVPEDRPVTPAGPVPGQKGGRGKSGPGVASMVDQTPPPSMQTARPRVRPPRENAGGNHRPLPGHLANAIQALQTV